MEPFTNGEWLARVTDSRALRVQTVRCGTGGLAAGSPPRVSQAGRGRRRGQGAAGAGVKVSPLPGASTEPSGEVVGKVWDARAVERGGGKVGSSVVPGEAATARANANWCGELSACPSPSCLHAFP